MAKTALNPYRPQIKKSGMFGGYGWFYVPEWNITIGASPKAGTTALKKFMQDNKVNCKFITRDQIPKASEVCFVVRNPLEKFASLWKNKCRDKKAIVDKDIHGLSPQDLMAHISSGKRDVHWTPQHELLGNLDATLIPLEELQNWWRNRGYGEIETFNETEGAVLLDETIREWVSDFYAKDYELYSLSLVLPAANI